MAYSESDFNETEVFDEYNPHPYKGGYDIALTYGPPLSPSDAICYPISETPPSLEEEGPVIGYGRPHDPTESLEKEKPSPVNGHDSGSWLDNPEYGGFGGEGGSFSSGYGYGNDHVEEDYGYGNGHVGGDYGYGHDALEPLPDYNNRPSDPEPYSDLFGYWPFFQGHGESYGRRDVEEQGSGSPWEGAGDYIFGSLQSYGEKRDESHNYGNLNYAYERHSYEQPFSFWVEPTEFSWSQTPSYSEVYQEQLHPNYAYERHGYEQPPCVQVGSNELSWSQNPSSEVYQEQVYPQPKCVYAYERHHYEQPLSVQVEPSEQTWSREPSYYEVYQEQVHPPSEHVYAYESHFNEQPLCAQVKTIEPQWSYYELCQEEAYSQSKQDDDSCKESDAQTYCPFQKYSDYDD